MEDVMFHAAKGANGMAQVRSAQLPLAMVHEGQTVEVTRVRGAEDFVRHLNSMGFVEGAKIKVVSSGGGDTVVTVKGATLGIGRDTAMHIITC